MSIDRGKLRQLLQAGSGTDLELYAAIHHERRKIRHEKALAIQPKITTEPPQADVRWFMAELMQPLTLAEQSTDESLDYDCLIVHDCVLKNDFWDTVWALARLYRRYCAIAPHMQHIPKVKPPAGV